VKLPIGYRYASVYAGIRKQAGRDDVALIVSDAPASCAAVFTKNMVQAAPVRLAKQNLKSSKGKVKAILVNAGNANCATRTGDAVASTTCKTLAKALKAKRDQVLPASTGVIGVELDPQLITEAIPALIQNLNEGQVAFENAAHAILTTDTRMKIATEEVKLCDGVVQIAGMTKGSGMIQPSMATTLGFVMTDAAIAHGDLRKMLDRAIEGSYNSLTVDGDTSTNDVVAVLANGASGVEPGKKELAQFEEALAKVLASLAKQIAADGEGARKLVIIETAGFKTNAEARTVARSIANSPLVKTAIAGSDPNWGRILAAAGYSGIEFDPAKVDIYLQKQLVCQDGLAAELDEAAMKEKLNEAEVHIQVTLKGKHKGAARFFTCDLTEGYIEINGSYRT
jgi:glutamate N-acetyltransferase / amino-acid N-acetyltransferase